MVQAADAHLASLPGDNSLQAHEGSPYQVLRWWPGIGSFAMATVIHKRARCFLQDCRTKGRATLVVLWNKPIKPGAKLLGTDAVVLAGVHATTGEDIVPLLQDLADLFRHTPSGARRLLIGDWNLDVKKVFFLLSQPAAAPSPSGGPSHFSNFDDDNWLALSAFAEAGKLKYSLASMMLEAQQFQGIWPLDTPFARVPRGGQALSSSPSWLDWGLASHDWECPCKASWHDVPADHAWVIWELKLQFKRHPSDLPPHGSARMKTNV
jgi:hypothetical protein